MAKVGVNDVNMRFVARPGADPTRCKRHGMDIDVSVASGTKVRACACFRLTFPASSEGTALIERLERPIPDIDGGDGGGN